MNAHVQSLLIALCIIPLRYGKADFASDRLNDTMKGLKYVNAEDVLKMQKLIAKRGDGYGVDWMIMPDGDGNPAIALLSKRMLKPMLKSNWYDLSFSINQQPEELVTFSLYTRYGPEEGITFNENNLDELFFDGDKPTKVIIHGWRSDSFSTTVTSIRDAYLNVSDVNVITVDWSNAAKNFYYPASAAYVQNVGTYVAEMINHLVVDKGANFGNFHLIGHSLGAHTAGVAGAHTIGHVGRVTGLDPALPKFDDAPDLYSLDKSDAEFVDVIHTCSGFLGLSAPVGHVDFYPNGGSPFQPGCCCFTEIIGICSHGRSHQYFAESIESMDAFQAVQCNSWNQFTTDHCDSKSTVTMGEYVPFEARGSYYLKTDSKSPFGLGMDGIIT